MALNVEILHAFFFFFFKKTEEPVSEVLEVKQERAQWEKAYWLLEKLEHSLDLKKHSQGPKWVVKCKKKLRKLTICKTKYLKYQRKYTFAIVL